MDRVRNNAGKAYAVENEYDVFTAHRSSYYAKIGHSHLTVPCSASHGIQREAIATFSRPNWLAAVLASTSEEGTAARTFAPSPQLSW